MHCPTVDIHNWHSRCRMKTLYASELLQAHGLRVLQELHLPLYHIRLKTLDKLLHAHRFQSLKPNPQSGTTLKVEVVMRQ